MPANPILLAATVFALIAAALGAGLAKRAPALALPAFTLPSVFAAGMMQTALAWVHVFEVTANASSGQKQELFREGAALASEVPSITGVCVLLVAAVHVVEAMRLRGNELETPLVVRAAGWGLGACLMAWVAMTFWRLSASLTALQTLPAKVVAANLYQAVGSAGLAVVFGALGMACSLGAGGVLWMRRKRDEADATP